MTRKRPRGLLIFLALATSVVAACGSSGHGGGDGGGANNGGGGAVQPNVTGVSGTFYLGATDRPAAGYAVWLLDQTGFTYTRFLLGDDGKFSMPITSFTEGHVYSLHLAKDYHWLADFDFSQANAGLQAAFTYQGGYGFDLGDVILPLNSSGAVDNTGGFYAAVGGGFNLSSGVDGALAAYKSPAFAPLVTMGSQLDVMDPTTLLYSFYGRTQNPTLYARDLAALSRIGFAATGAEAGELLRVDLVDAGSWLAAARLPAASDSTPDQSAFWLTSGSEVTQVDDTHFRAGVFVGAVPEPGTLAVLRARPQAGPQALVPRVLGQVLALPPSLEAASTSGGTPAVIDYTATTGENGLTRPFCQTGEVVLDLAPPRDVANQSVAALNDIDVEFDYYAEASGQLTALTATPEQFPGPYSAAFEDTTLSGMTRSWDPATLRLRFALDEATSSAASQEIRIWPDLFLATLNDQAVSKIRLRIYYRSDMAATEGGIVVWLAKGC